MQAKNYTLRYWTAGCLFIFAALYLYKQNPFDPARRAAPIQKTTTTTTTSDTTVVSPHYTIKQFDLAGTLHGLSANQIKQHEELYAGYVKKRNEITQALQTVDRSNVASRTYSPYRELKLEETYAVNGAILHELYFENLSAAKTAIGPRTQKLLEDSFGSLEKFKQDLMDAANSARGWVVTAYSLDDGKVHNFLLEEHNTHVPVLTMPLLVIDVYEHAYMIDFGIKRPPYLDVIWNNINWDVVEKRIQKWVAPFNKEQPI